MKVVMAHHRNRRGVSSVRARDRHFGRTGLTHPWPLALDARRIGRIDQEPGEQKTGRERADNGDDTYKGNDSHRRAFTYRGT